MRDEAHCSRRQSLERRSRKAVGELFRGLLRAVGLPRREAAHVTPSRVGCLVSLGKLLACRNPFSPLRRVGDRLNTTVGLSNAIDHA